MRDPCVSVEFPLSNKYTFSRVFSDPGNVRPLLEVVLGVPIGEIRYVVSEHAVDPSLRGRGVRMDVLVDDGSGAVFDVEMQNVGEGNLALRSRYLLSSFDRDRLARGHDYDELGMSVVIFVCCFDPIGLGERMYVMRPMVVGHDLPFDDNTQRVFLNAKGAARDSHQGGPLARLNAFLSYIDGGDTMGDEWVEHLDEKVRELNADEGWRESVLSFEMDLLDAERKGQAEGMQMSDEINRSLLAALRACGREEEMFDALTDADRKTQLLKEFGLGLPRLC